MRTTGTDPGGIGETIAVGTPPSGVSAAVKTMMRKGGVPGVSLAVVSRDRCAAGRRLGVGRPLGEPISVGIHGLPVVLDDQDRDRHGRPSPRRRGSPRPGRPGWGVRGLPAGTR